MRKIITSSALAAMSLIMTGGATYAAMAPTIPDDPAKIVRVDCAAGVHLGPSGTCILGTDDRAPPPPPPAVVERPAVDPGCTTRTEKRTNGEGDSQTRSVTNCD
jgi:hypothetical protein